MQFLGHLKIDGETMLVLVRASQYYNSFKIRKSGKPGQRMNDEETWLSEDRDTLARLLAGEVVRL